MHGDPLGRAEARRAAMAQLRRALHEPLAVAILDAELVQQGAAGPERGGLLVFCDGDALALHVPRRFDARIPADQDVRMEEAPRREDRQADESVIALRQG